jgi:valyl-tRNA synthetase
METDPAAVRSTLYTVLTDTFKLLHPIAPFITEELWNTLNRTVGLNPPHPDLSFNPWPAPPAGALDPAIISEMNLVKEAIRSIRTIRSTLNVPAGQEVNASISFQVPARRDTFARHIPIIRRLAKVAVLDLVLGMDRPKNTAVDIRGEITIFVPLAGLIDIADEKAKLLTRLEQKTRYLAACDGKLHNQSFLANAPPEIISKEWERKRNLQAEIEQINTFLANLE